MSTYDPRTDHKAHVYAFWNAPLIQRTAWVQAQIAELETELHSDNRRSTDEYYAIKDKLRTYTAALSGKTAREYDPMGTWHGMQSN